MCEIVYNILITNFTVYRCIIRSNAPSNLQMQPLGCIFRVCVKLYHFRYGNRRSLRYGGMLTVAQDRLLTLAKRRGKEVAIHLFGQEINPETYAICTADMLLKGDGEEAEHIMYGSTLSDDQHASRQFDFMLSNPPYGKSWKTDAEKMGGKKEILDTRFNTYLEGGEVMPMIPRTSDGQLLFLLNNIAKMKKDTALGSRIAEVHNASSLFTGDAGSGEKAMRDVL